MVLLSIMTLFHESVTILQTNQSFQISTKSSSRANRYVNYSEHLVPLPFWIITSCPFFIIWKPSQLMHIDFDLMRNLYSYNAFIYYIYQTIQLELCCETAIITMRADLPQALRRYLSGFLQSPLQPPYPSQIHVGNDLTTKDET